MQISPEHTLDQQFTKAPYQLHFTRFHAQSKQSPPQAHHQSTHTAPAPQINYHSSAMASDAAPAILIVLITILLPPVGVLMVAGCGADFVINICLTLLGYIPGHIHAFYIEYVYFDRRSRARHGELTGRPASGVYSDRVQAGGNRSYGTV